MAGPQQLARTVTPTMLRARAELGAKVPDDFWSAAALPGGVNRLDDDIRLAFTKVIPHVKPIDWADTPIPFRWHSCTKMSERGETRARGKNSVIPTEVCPCGGYRMLNMRDGKPSYWMDRNTRRRSR